MSLPKAHSKTLVLRLGVNKLWRAALLSSSLELRKSLLKGRIWGFGPEEDNVFISTRFTHESGRRVPSTVLEREEPTLLAPATSPACPLGWSRDSGDHFEGHLSRSSSVLSFESDTSLKHATSPHPARSRALSTSSAASSGVGRVREIIRNLERDRNALNIEVGQSNEDPCLASDEMTSESEDDQGVDAAGNSTIIVHESEDLAHSNAFHETLESMGARPTGSPVTSQSSNTNETTLIETTPLLPSVDLPTIPQRAHSSISLLRDPGESKWATLNEEPTIEALLREEGGIQEERPRATSWGAEAWEVDFPGGTSRRVPVSASIAHAGSKSPMDNAQGELIVVARAVWDNLSRRLDETERRLAILEKEEAKGKQGAEIPSQNIAGDLDESKASASRGLLPVTLPPYLVVVGVGVCALVAQFVLGRVVGRRSRL